MSRLSAVFVLGFVCSNLQFVHARCSSCDVILVSSVCFVRCAHMFSMSSDAYICIAHAYVTMNEATSSQHDFACDVDERVRDQFIAYVADYKIRERLFQEPNDRTLAQVITLASTLEKSTYSSNAIARSIGGELPTASSPSSIMAKSSSSSSANVDRVKTDNVRKAENVRQRSVSRHYDNSSGGLTCYACGRRGHKSNAADCPARNGTCNSCGQRGHYSKCCRNGKSQHGRSSSNNRGRRDQTPISRGDKSTSTVSVSAVDNAQSRGDLRRIHCLVDGEDMDLLVDLGSQISIISYAEYKRSLSRHKLRRADITLRGYGAAPITCFGYLEIPVEYGEIRIPSFRFYVTKRGDCLLGIDLFDRLGFRILEPGTSNGARDSDGERRNPESGENGETENYGEKSALSSPEKTGENRRGDLRDRRNRRKRRNPEMNSLSWRRSLTVLLSR